MLTRFMNLSRSACWLLRALVAALLPAVAGCDRKPQWRGVGTDAGYARLAPNPDASRMEQQRWRCQLSRAAGDA
jgi:hypothetical protein